MKRTVFVVRHERSEGNRHNQASFGPEGGVLVAEGIERARSLRNKLLELGIDVATESVAVSDMKRAYETAFYAGFVNITKYAVLNEVGVHMSPELLDSMLDRKEAPEEAITAAQSLLRQQPPERVWVTHGQVIAGLAHELEIPTSELFIPDLGSITKLAV